MFEAQDILTCIGEGRFFLERNRPKISAKQYFQTPQELETLLEDIPKQSKILSTSPKNVT